LSPLETESGVLVSSAIRDVTARKKAEDDLRGAKVRAEAATAELESFSYSVAHDLRAPLRAIDGFSQVLQSDYADRLDAEANDSLTRVRSAAQRMALLIDALLGLSRVSRGDFVRERVDLTLIARQIAVRLRESAPSRVVEVSVHDDMFALGDARLVSAVLANLMENAWKFTGRREIARIEVGSATLDGVRTFFVRDNGVGFKAEYAPKLFAPFQRLHGVAEFEGTGIGLATVQRVVRRHGGSVWAEGELDRGATVYFTLEPREEAGASPGESL
jgi:light-regulated signal transduction histidine kinase (bacteriophytochrome)